MPEPRILRRYASHRLYDPAFLRYVSAEEVRGWLRRGEPVTILDARTGEDVTSTVA